MNVIQCLYIIYASIASVILNELAEEHGLYPIRTVAQMTGVNPITLRAWERRYGMIQPKRTAKGHRLYSLKDIEEIRRITDLLDQGVSIGQVSPVLEHSPPASQPDIVHGDSWTDSYAHALARLDEPALNALEAQALSMAQVNDVLAAHLLPLLDRLERVRSHDLDRDVQYRLLQTRLTHALAQQVRYLSATLPPARVLASTLPPERSMFALWHLAWTSLRAQLPLQALAAGLSANQLTHAQHLAGYSTLVLLLDSEPPLAVMGTQLPLLVAADWSVLALGRYAHTKREELSALGIHVPPAEDESPLDFIRARL